MTKAETKAAVLLRLRRKLEILKLDAGKQPFTCLGDIKECLALLDLLEKTEADGHS